MRRIEGGSPGGSERITDTAIVSAQRGEKGHWRVAISLLASGPRVRCDLVALQGCRFRVKMLLPTPSVRLKYAGPSQEEIFLILRLNVDEEPIRADLSPCRVVFSFPISFGLHPSPDHHSRGLWR